jgi:uncharacterized protein (TIGR00255 family)
MILSMTGYGRGEFENENYKIVTEMKTVNHRYCDIIIKMPKKLTALEERMKALIKERISRGRVEVYINYDEIIKNEYNVSPNFEVLDQYYGALTQIKDKYELKETISVGLLSKYPDALEISYEETDLEAVWAVMEKSLLNALDSVFNMRDVEGAKLKEDVISRVSNIKTMLQSIEALVPEIVQNHKEKMIERIRELLEGEVEVDQDRIIHEVAVYADKTSIAEEVTRLYSHFDQLDHFLQKGGSVGRKLDFLVQELNREVNTIGSKSPDIDISNYVIEMKSEVEKIREQIQNIE